MEKNNKPNWLTIAMFVFLAMFWIDFLLSALTSSLASANNVSASSTEEEVIKEETKRAEQTEETNIGGQCFITENKWYEGASTYRVVYAIDTKVKYLVITGRYGSSVTPLYNADGTLQVFTEEN